KESAVRHTVSRARASLRRVMSELIVDKERGLTALDMLSTTYKKAAEVAKKSSKAALSLILVFFAFLGFNSMPTVSNLPVLNNEVISSAPSTDSSSSSPSADSTSKASPSASAKSEGKAPSRASIENVKSSDFRFAGLDKNGVPTSFTVSDSSGSLGSLYITKRPPVMTDTDLTLNGVAKTDTGAANIFLSQTLTSSFEGFSYAANISAGMNGEWIPLNTTLNLTSIERLLSGNYLVTAVFTVESVVETSIQIAATANGRDLTAAPKQVITRLVLNPSKTEIMAQAVYVIETRAK
ncbi:hypothetical protein EBT31_14590, partial [bacterium]|nr:hypothetical protein [bacterium]